MLKKFAFAATAIALLAGCATGPSFEDRQAYVNEHPASEVASDNYPELRQKYNDAILKGEVTRGMSQEDVIASWGKPCGWCPGTRKTSMGESWEYNMFGSAGGLGTVIYFDEFRKVSGWSGF